MQQIDAIANYTPVPQPGFHTLGGLVMKLADVTNPKPLAPFDAPRRQSVRVATILERNQAGLARLQQQLQELEGMLHTFLIPELPKEDQTPLDLTGKSELYSSLERQERVIGELETRLRRLMARIDVT